MENGKLSRLLADTPLHRWPVRWFLLFAFVALVALFAHGFYRYLWDGQPQLIFAAGISALLYLPTWAAIFYLNRRNRVPNLLVFAVIASMFLFFGPIVSQVNRAAGNIMPATIAVGFIEESFKVAPLLLLAWLVPRAVTSTRDGLVLGALGGLAFSMLEFGAYIALIPDQGGFMAGLKANLPRVNLLGTNSHVLLSTLIGGAIGWGLTSTASRTKRVVVPIAVYLGVACLHSLQDSGGNVMSTLLAGMVVEPILTLATDPEALAEHYIVPLTIVLSTIGMLFMNVLVIPALFILVHKSGDRERQIIREELQHTVGDLISENDYLACESDRRWRNRTIRGATKGQSKALVQLQNEYALQASRLRQKGHAPERDVALATLAKRIRAMS